MKHPERVEDYLGHIAEAIARATTYLRTVSDVEAFEKIYRSRMRLSVTSKLLAKLTKIQGVAPDFVKQHPELPWAQMRGMRNIVIHEYFFVDLK